MAEERLRLAVFIDFDNIQIGVKDTLAKDFDVSVVLEALKERGEVVTKIAYGDWSRSGETSRQMTQHAVQLVQRNVTPRGDKNGADINLALDALEMAFTREHINAYAIVGGDSDFIALVEKLKQYGKRVFVVGGRQFTSHILQRNCHEFLAYENLLKSDGGRVPRGSRASGRGAAESRSLSEALPNIQRALKVLAEREVAPQLGLLKSTLLQLDPTFTERDFGTGSFLDFMQKMQKAGLVKLRRTDRGFLVDSVTDGESVREQAAEAPMVEGEAAKPEAAEILPSSTPSPSPTPAAPANVVTPETLATLQQALHSLHEKSPNRPIYLRQIRQALRSLDGRFDDSRAGYRYLLDLLHAAQREGSVRLHRDRKGVWRIFPVVAAAAPAPGTPEVAAAPVAATDAEPAVHETDVDWEAPERPEEPMEFEEAPPAPAVIEEAVPGEPVAERKTRRTRGMKTGRSRTSTRRKTKPPAEP